MAEYRGFDLFEIIIFILKRKKIIIVTTSVCLILSYLGVYYFIPPQFEATSIIIASDENNFNPIASLTKNIGDLSLGGIGLGGLKSSEKYDLFTTLIFSRTNLEDLISKYNLMSDFGTDEKQKAIEILKSNITAEETNEGAYQVRVRASSATKSAAMTNYIVNKCNDAVIDLNIKKSKDNRMFLEKRYLEIKNELFKAENELKTFQKNTNVLDANEQIKTSLAAYAMLESQLINKEVEKSVLESLLTKGNHKVNLINREVSELGSKIDLLKKKGTKNGLLLPLEELPEKAVDYLRLYRNVEIYNTMLQFIIPVYEQAKYDEVKNIPVLQIIDIAKEPEKKSYPPRLVFALLITFSIISLSIVLQFIYSIIKSSSSSKIVFIRENLFR